MLKIVLDYKPQVLYGNKFTFDLLSIELQNGKFDLSGLNLKFIVVVGEIVNESSKKLYSELFKTKVVESYGTVEGGVLAFETIENKGLNLCEDLTYYEFLDSDGNPQIPGKPARIVFTDLSGRLMPFIRYDQGDQVIYNIFKNSDGHEVKRITAINGRDDDFIILPGGNKYSIHFVADIFNNYSEILQYRFVQKKLDEVKIYIITKENNCDGLFESISQKLQKKLPISFELIHVEKLEQDKSGKLRKAICEIVN
jgi:phenylacetate-CoA ligase